jgi:hypothetical protein
MTNRNEVDEISYTSIECWVGNNLLHFLPFYDFCISLELERAKCHIYWYPLLSAFIVISSQLCGVDCTPVIIVGTVVESWYYKRHREYHKVQVIE